MRASGRYGLPTGDFVRAEGPPIDGEVADRSTGADVRRVGKIGADVNRRRVTEIDRIGKLRLADAPLRLARGEQIVNVSLDAGYNDLSRFYKQFRKNTKTSPGACQTLLKPSAK